MKKRTRLFFLTMLCFAIMLSIFSFAELEAKADSSPVQLYVSTVDNTVESGTITNQKFGVVVAEPSYVYLRFPTGQTESRKVNTYFLFSYTLNGTYSVYGYALQADTANVIDLDLQITVDTVAPNITIFENNNTVPSNSFIKGDVSANATDGLTGVKEFMVSKNGEDFVDYNNETITEDGVYEFFATDKANNESRATITKDTVKPTLEVFADELALENHSTTNAPKIQLSAKDSLSGIESISVKLPNESSFSQYSQTDIEFSNSGVYVAYATDKSGNTSDIFTITVDNIPPAVSIHSGGTKLTNNSFINVSSIVYKVDKANATSYVYRTSSAKTTVILNNDTFSGEDTYTFYAIDSTGNMSEEITVTIDRTAPIGNFYVGGALSSKPYVNSESFCYTASDANPILVYAKRPNEDTFSLVDNSTLFYGEGTYSYFAEDAAGNQSAVQTITIDRVKPFLTLYADAAEKESGSFVNSSYIKAEATDNKSGIKAIYVKHADAPFYVVYSQGEQLADEGAYSFYCEDNAGNLSETKVIHLDKSAPIGTIFSDGTVMGNNSHTNKPFEFSATDSISGVFKLEIKKPSGVWENYTSGNDIAGIDGTYYFRATDRAGNVSIESVIVYDTLIPAVNIYAGASLVSDGGFSNAEYVMFVGADLHLLFCYVKTPSDSEFRKVESGLQYILSGDYEFFATDKAGNQSAIYSITLDKIKPLGTLVVDGVTVASDSHTNKPFSYSATDSISGVFKLEIKKPNGTWENYTSETSISGEDGTYYFRATDNVGNLSIESVITLDTGLPAVQILGDGIAKNSGSYTNSATLQFSGFDENLADCFIKLPSESTFKKIFSGTAYSSEGKYEFFATDKAGNQSEIFVITLDKSAPTGTLSVDGSTVLTNSFTNKPFSYVATDNASGVFKLEIKKPSGVWETYSSATEIGDVDGKYYFRATDNVGNVSTESVITFDTTLPVVKIYAGAEEKSHDSFSNADYIKFVASDINLDLCYIKVADGEFELMQSGAGYSFEGRYEFFATDKAGNQSSIFAITLDYSKPSGAIFIDGIEVESGAYTNKGFSYVGYAGQNGINHLQLKRPSGEWENYTAQTLIEPSGENGKYSFRCVDNIGNISPESVIYLDTTAPNGTLFADENVVQNGAYTNALRISFISESDDLKAVFVKLPNESDFKNTNSGVLYSAEGRYEFYAIDYAENVSQIYTLIVDRTPKSVTLVNVLNGKADKDVVITYSNTLNLAPIISVMVNGIEVENGKIIATINGGNYDVICADEAGNTWTSTFVATRIDVETTTTNQYWWEASSSENTYSFVSYENALAFATEREQALIKTKTWNGDTWDTGYIMDSIDSTNAKQGTFYVYKKQDNPNVEVAYFTQERLSAVIKTYAQKGIAKYYYWEKIPATPYANNNIFHSSNGKITAKSITLRANLAYKINGIIASTASFSEVGKHTLTIFDDYGNSYDCDIAIVDTVPQLEFRYANGDYYLANNTQPYYLKNRITIKVVDLLDDFAVAAVKNSKGELMNVVNLGEELIITEAGKYVIQTINHAGTKEYVFYISYNAPTISVTENATTKRLEVAINPSIDKDMSLLDISIFRSENGTDWTLLNADDYGLDISLSHLKYSFFKSGFYRISVEDICRSGIDAVVSEAYFDKPQPVGTLEGVNENGYSNTCVSFVWTDEAYANLFFNGVETEYSSGTILTDEGEYKLTFRDLNGYSYEYNFIIDKTAPDPITSENIASGFVKENAITWEKTNVTAVVYLGDTLLFDDYEQGTPLNENGNYRVELRDLAGNISVIEFVIDNIAPTATLLGVQNNSTTKSKVTLTNLSKPAQITAQLNGKEFNYTVGESLTKVGKYKILLTDEAGNTTEYTFEILYSINGAGIFFIVLVCFMALAAATMIILKRKKQLFKKRS